MAITKYKYNINHQISLLPRGIYIGDIASLLLQNYGISESSFYRDRFIPVDSDQDIPGQRLEVYARVFDCSIEDLLNYKIKGKSIREVMKDSGNGKPASSKVKSHLQ